MLTKKQKNSIVRIKSKEVSQIKKKFDIGLIRNAAFSIGTDFNSARVALNDPKTIPLIVPLLRKSLQGKGVIENYQPFKISRLLSRMKLTLFLVASDRELLGGDPAHIRLVKTGAEVCVIQHDFFIDEVQIYQAKSYGSDGILLDSDLLDPKKLASFAEIAFQMGMEAFLKIYHPSDLQYIDHEIIGGLVFDGERISENLHSEFYTMLKEEKFSQLPKIIGLSRLSSVEISQFNDYGIYHFLLSEDWLQQPDALLELERLIQKNWPDQNSDN
jgi:indole-3-glycerol phosphate synthase